MEEKILTLNLSGKKGVNIQKRKYDAMKEAIVNSLQNGTHLTLVELNSAIEKDIGATFDGKVGWYFMAVKLDLEARGLLVRVPKKSPQTLMLSTGTHESN